MKYISLRRAALMWSKMKTYVGNQISGFYTKPSAGIPKTDLDESVRASLGKADSALQEHQDISSIAADVNTLSQNLTALGPKIDQNKADIAALQEEVVEVGARAGSYDHIPLLGGQPMILFGSGAPVEANVPENWIGFDDGGFEWIGTPSMMGQQYIDTTNGEKYVSIKNGFTLSWLKV